MKSIATYCEKETAMYILAQNQRQIEYLFYQFKRALF